MKEEKEKLAAQLPNIFGEASEEFIESIERAGKEGLEAQSVNGLARNT